MGENSYEEYKRNLSRSQRKQEHFHKGIALFFIGIALLLYALCTLPFRADQGSDRRGDELRAGKAYYIEGLQLLHAKVDAANDQVYCIAKFPDKEQNEWILAFTPGSDEQLTKQITLAVNFGKEIDLELSGYFYLEELPDKVSSYYAVYGDKYANPDGTNTLDLNADYLCGVNGNYTFQALLRPGRTKASFVWGVLGIVIGGIWVIRNRTNERKVE